MCVCVCLIEDSVNLGFLMLVSANNFQVLEYSMVANGCLLLNQVYVFVGLWVFE